MSSDPAPFLAATPSGPFIPTQPLLPEEPHAPVRDTYLKWFRQYGEQYAVPWHLLAALAYSENKYQTQPPSHMGAQGIMQFMPLTWQDMQAQLGVTDPLDPEQSIQAAAYYLAQIRSYLARHQKYGDSWMLAGFNAGMGRASTASWESMPPETRAYVDEILEHSEALRRWEDGWNGRA
jgi:soluble lytic murein transglycosylase-like protein